MTTRPPNDAGLERPSALLSAIVSHISGGFSVSDADGRLVVWNEAFVELTGIDPSVVREGADIRDLLISQARAGEFGQCDPEAEADRRLDLLHGDRQVISERKRPNGRVVEVRRNPMPGGGSVTINETRG